MKDPWQLATIAREKDFFTSGWYASREEAFTYAQMESLRQHQHAFSDILTFWPTRFNLSTGGRSRYAEGLLVSSNFLDVLGITPIAGRAFAAENDKVACSSAQAVLSYSFWQREFGGDVNAIGRNVSLDGHRFTVSGITPPSFFGVEPGQRFDVALPLCAENVFTKDGKGRASNRIAFWLTAIGRLKPGWSVDEGVHGYPQSVAHHFPRNGADRIPARRGEVVSEEQIQSDLCKRWGFRTAKAV